MNTLVHKFEELPAFTELGFGYGNLAGEADIRFDRSGEWFIGEIRLDGSRFDRKTGKWEHIISPLCRQSHPELFLSIHDALETGARKDSIQDAVNEILAEEGTPSHSDRADHSTHFAEYSGAV